MNNRFTDYDPAFQQLFTRAAHGVNVHNNDKIALRLIQYSILVKNSMELKFVHLINELLTSLN